MRLCGGYNTFVSTCNSNACDCEAHCYLILPGANQTIPTMLKRPSENTGVDKPGMHICSNAHTTTLNHCTQAPYPITI